VTKGETTRQRIIEAAAPIFNRQGFAGASIQDVMDATGLEKGCIYRHFEGKEELAAASFRYALSRAVKTRTDDVDHVPGALGKLRYLVDRFVVAPSPMPGGCPLLNTAIDADDGNPMLRKLARDGIADWKSRLATIVADGQNSGEIRRKTDPGQIANAIVGLLEGSLMISRIEGNKSALSDARATLHLLLDGLTRG